MNILRPITGICIIFFCTLFGIKKANDLKKREETLFHICLAIEKISARVTLCSEDMEEILKKYLPLGISYNKGVLVTQKNLCLKKEDVKILEDFLFDSGMERAKEERVRCLCFKTLFEKQYQEASLKNKEQHKLYSVGGFMVGTALFMLWW